MLTYCHHWELERESPPAHELSQRLAQLSHTEALLVLRRTSFPSDWNQAHFYELLTGPSRYARTYTRQSLPDGQIRSACSSGNQWLSEFETLRQLAEQRLPTSRQAQGLISRILSSLNEEERAIYPKVSAYLRYPRVTRTLTYEHDGIRRYLKDLEPTLEKLSLEPETSKKLWSKLSLDLIHLIEHHVVHEEPILALAASISDSPGRQSCFIGEQP